MIPSLAVIRIRGRGGRRLHLWIPLIAVWILLLPAAVLALPLLFGLCLVGRVSVAGAFRAIAETFVGLKGAQVEVEDGRHSVWLHIA